MNVVSVINCPNRACAEKIIASARIFLRIGDWIHVDVTDGIFSTHKTWNNPAAWSVLKIPFNLEVHLMVVHPEDHITPWLAAGAKKIIVHVEAISPESIKNILSTCHGKGADVTLASNPETSIEKIEPYMNLFSEFLVLAVRPGPAGQLFNPSVLEKIKALKKKNAIMIEVDGGINPATARLAKDAGADIITSGAYIFDSADPQKAYEELRKI
jgi:ribulose-phosphate 3-epimerase